MAIAEGNIRIPLRAVMVVGLRRPSLKSDPTNIFYPTPYA
jgi:hypothetical protein